MSFGIRYTRACFYDFMLSMSLSGIFSGPLHTKETLLLMLKELVDIQTSTILK